MRRIGLVLVLLLSVTVSAVRMDMPVFDGEDWISLEYIGGDRSGENIRCIRQGNDWKALITLDKVPDVNSWTYKIEDGNQFNYNYQEPFRNFEVFYRDNVEWHRAAGPANTILQRPYYIEGSWAVRHKTKRDHILGQKNYKTGKAFHIIADAWDAAGNHIMPRIVIKDGIYTVSVDRCWLECAEYPVIVNDTWGWTAEESTEWIIAGAPDQAVAVYLGNPPANGTITQVSIYNRAVTAGTLGFYAESASHPGNATADTAEFTSTSAVALTWDHEAMDGSSYPVTTSDDLWIGGNFDDSIAIGTDQAAGSQDCEITDAGGSDYVAGVLPNWPGETSSPTYDVSFYATYTPSGSVPVAAFRRRM